MLLEDRRGGTVHVPADQHVDGLGDLRRNGPNTSYLSSPPLLFVLRRQLTIRRPYRPDADALGEAVVCLDVLVELLDGSPPQRRAVVGLVDVQHHCKKEEENHWTLQGFSEIKVIIVKRTRVFNPLFASLTSVGTSTCSEGDNSKHIPTISKIKQVLCFLVLGSKTGTIGGRREQKERGGSDGGGGFCLL